jgi:hypothetical protein
VNINPVGDWTTQAEDPFVLFRALGEEIVIQQVIAGDREALFSVGFSLVSEADGATGTPLGAAGRSPKADVGLALCTDKFPATHQKATRRCGHLTTKRIIILVTRRCVT